MTRELPSFVLTGKINNSGLVEIPMGTTIRTLVYEIGEGCLIINNSRPSKLEGPQGDVFPPNFWICPLILNILTIREQYLEAAGLLF